MYVYNLCNLYRWEGDYLQGVDIKNKTFTGNRQINNFCLIKNANNNYVLIIFFQVINNDNIIIIILITTIIW